MSDTTSAVTETSSEDWETSSEEESSIEETSKQEPVWGESLDLATFKTDPERWNEKWEDVLDTLSSQEAYSLMGHIFRKGRLDAPGGPLSAEGVSKQLMEEICLHQNMVVDVWRKEEGDLRDDFSIAWALLNPSEQTRHLLVGFKHANRWHRKGGPLTQDSRSLCPELRTSLLSGPAFTHFVDTCVVGKEAIEDPTIPYLLPSAWWDEASNGIPEDVVEEFDESCLNLLTLLRNLYICMLSCSPLVYQTLTVHLLSISCVSQRYHVVYYGRPGERKFRDGPY